MMAAGSGCSDSEAMSAGRRFAIGANVTIAIVAAAALLVAVNWICSIKSVRKDAASFSHYGLSDRTKRILDNDPEEIRLSVLYASGEDDEEQQGHVSRLTDYCDELERYAPQVTVQYVAKQSQREKLVSQISSTFGGEAAEHKSALSSFERLRGELDAALEERLLEAAELMDKPSWLGDFPLFAHVASLLRSDQEALKQAAEEIAEFTPAGGIPKYGDATSRAKQALTELKGHFEAVSARMGEMAPLADETSKADSEHVAMLRQVAAEANKAVAGLRQLVGDQGAPMPADPAAALSALKDRGTEVGAQLEVLVRRVGDFARAFPMVRQHTKWRTTVKMGPVQIQMAVADVLQRAVGTLGQIRLAILNVLDRGDPEELQATLAAVRRDVAVLEQNASVCEQLLTELADRLAAVDEGSKALLEASRGGGLLSSQVAATEEVIKEIEGLPELKLGSVADQLKEENVLVIEANKKIRVLGFSEVFPMRESVGGPRGGSEELGRTFNGDSAISSGILALTQDHPSATVVLVSFEPPAPQQRGPFSPPPPMSCVPSRALSELRARLGAANFKVVDWNLATTDAAPQPEEGTENVYVLLPPAPPSQPNPFAGRQPPGPTFGEKHRKKIRDLLDNDGRMIFLAAWEVRGGGMFGGGPRTPPYGYQRLLKDDWGIRVNNGRRVVWIEPDRQKAQTFMIALRRFNYMPVGRFLDHPVGVPLRGTRFLVNDACPIEVAEELPEGVTVSGIVRVPRKENYIGAELSEVIQIIDQLQNPMSDGKVTLDPFPAQGPFDMMVAAQRQEGDTGKGRIVVMGFGVSLHDRYLMNPVMASGEVLRLDPPPTENVDLFINALYWLQGQTRWIARGPVPVPRVEPIEAGELIALRVGVWGVWPAVVFAFGIVVWWVRRR